MKTFFTLGVLAMIQILTAVLVFIGSQAGAESVSKNFSIRDSKRPVLSAAEIRQRFTLTSQAFVSDSTGRLLFVGGSSRAYTFDGKGDLTVFEMTREADIKDLAFKMVWKIADSGKITAHIQQFETMTAAEDGGDPKLGKLLREEKIEIKDFAPVEWPAFTDGGQRVIVRITPGLADKTEEPIDVEAAALSFSNAVMFDNKGFHWASMDGSLEGRYLSLRTHKGQVVLSFVPFKGAKEIGVAKGNQVTISGPSGLKIFLRSADPVVIGSRPAKIYGIVDLSKKTARANSVHAQSGDKENEFLRDL